MNHTLSPVLIVEDRLVDLDLTKRAFARRRFINPILEARDGEEALAYIEKWEAGEERPVCILLDLGLPKISGLEVLRRYKRHPTSASNLRWMSSAPNSWIGGKMKKYKTRGKKHTGVKPDCCA